MPAPILVTRRIPDAGLRRLTQSGLGFDVLREDRPPTPGELITAVPGRKGILATVADRIDEAALEAAGASLRAVANFAVGYNNIDVEACTRRGVAVTNTPGVLTEATADIAWTLILMAARRAGEGERLVRSGGFHGWGPMMLLGVDLVEKTLGIAGAGRIGQAVARRALGWRMNVLYTARSPKPDLERECGARRVDLDVLCRESDVITVHVPASPETRHLFGAREFGLMKSSAIFVNTSRGEIHDEAALATALAERRLFAAGLDVYEREPAIAPGLLALDSAVLLPHMGSGTIQTRERMAIMAADNLIAALRGERPPNLVNSTLFP